MPVHSEMIGDELSGMRKRSRVLEQGSVGEAPAVFEKRMLNEAATLGFAGTSKTVRAGMPGPSEVEIDALFGNRNAVGFIEEYSG